MNNPNPLPAANSRRPFCFRRLKQIPGYLASSELVSPAAVAEVYALELQRGEHDEQRTVRT
jgi:hypothetical protein